MATLRPNWPPGLPSPQALQEATNELCRQYVLPGTVLHPVLVRQALELAYLLTAYGLVPAEPQPAAAQPDITLDTTWRAPRTKVFRSRRHDIGQSVNVVEAVLTMS
jgi:hypothetical protein